ncbi:MAG: hypothetical protein R3B48_06065 [Kofleriaceae bacterium]
MTPGRRAGAGLAAALVGAVLATGSACGGGRPVEVASAPAAPLRAATAGDALLTQVPPGAEVLLELDLARARAHAALGPLFAALLEPGAAPAAAAALGPLASGTALVVASYRVGTADAQSLTLVAVDPAGAAPPGATELRPGVVALGPPALVAVARATAASPPALAPLRARAMPEGAEGAVLRVTAELSFDARLELAKQLGLDPPPARISLWADALDDAALVLLVDSAEAEDARGPERLEAALRGAARALEEAPATRLLGLTPALRGATFQRVGTWVKATVVVPPGRLRRIAARARAWIAARPAAAARPDRAVDSALAGPAARPDSADSAARPEPAARLDPPADSAAKLEAP